MNILHWVLQILLAGFIAEERLRHLIADYSKTASLSKKTPAAAYASGVWQDHQNHPNFELV